jgi:cell shape-determining protein MreD
MNTILVVFVGFIGTVIQGTWVAGTLPTSDINLVVSIHLGLTRTPVAGSIAAFVSGLITDLATGCPKGLATGQSTIAFFLSYSLTSRFVVRGAPAEFMYVLALSVVTTLYASLVLAWIPARALFPPPAVLSVVAHVVATSLLAPIVFAIIRRIDHAFERPTHRRM